MKWTSSWASIIALKQISISNEHFYEYLPKKIKEILFRMIWLKNFKIKSSVEALLSTGLPIPLTWKLWIFVSGEKRKGKLVASNLANLRTSAAWSNVLKSLQQATTRQPSGEWSRTIWSGQDFVSTLMAATSNTCWNRCFKKIAQRNLNDLCLFWWINYQLNHFTINFWLLKCDKIRKKNLYTFVFIFGAQILLQNCTHI